MPVSVSEEKLRKTPLVPFANFCKLVSRNGRQLSYPFLTRFMRYTVRPTLLAHKANKKGMSTLRIAVTIDGNISYMATTYRVHSKQWDADRRIVINHPNADLINVDLRRQISEIEKKIIRSSLQSIPVSKRILQSDKKTATSFASFAAEVRKEQKEINRVTDFAGPGLLLSDIDVTFLRKYEAHERGRGMAQNTLNTSFKYLRRILNQAKAEGLITANPFDDYDIPRYKQTDRIYLVDDELQKFVGLLQENLPEHLYRTLCYFLLGCYSGLRHSDWMRFNPETMVDGEFLRLRAKKNKTFVVLPIGPTLAGIIDRLRDMPPPFTNQKTNEKLKLLAILAKVKKPVSSHTGRHTFGYICASNKIPKSTTAELLGVHTSTVEVYFHLTGDNVIQQAAILKQI